MSKKKRFQPTTPIPKQSEHFLNRLVGHLPWFLALVWAFYVVIQFYQFSPFPLTEILSLLLPDNLRLIPTAHVFLNDAAGLFFAFVLLFAAFATGYGIVKRYLGISAGALEKLVLSAVLGYGIISYVALGLTVVGGAQKIVFKSVIFSIAIGGLILFIRRDERSILRQSIQEKISIYFSSGRSLVLSLFIVFILITDVVMTFVPEIFYDALVYHLGVPNLYLMEGRFVPLDMLTAKFPFLVQMIYMVGLALRDDIVTRLTHVFMLMLILGGMAAWGLRLKRPIAGIIAGLLFASIPTVQLNVITSGVDVGVSLFSFVSAWTLFVSLTTDEKSDVWFYFSAIFAGLAMSTKYTTILIPFILVLTFVAVSVYRKKPWREWLGRTALYGLIGVIILSPWLIKNWMEVKNPVYPFLSQIFGGNGLEPWRYEYLRAQNYGLPIESIMDAIKMFWNLSLRERSSLSFQGPLYLAFAPLLIWWARKERNVMTATLTLFACLFLVLVPFMTRLTRYWMPGLAILALPLGLSISSLLEEKGFFRRSATLLVLIMGVWFQVTWFYIFVHSSYQPRDVLLGIKDRNTYLTEYHSGMNPNSSMPMYLFMKSHFSKTDKVLLLGEEKAYPIEVRHVYSGAHDRGPLVRFAESSQTPQELADQLIQAGITHLMVNLAESYRVGDYGIYDFTPQAFGRFCAFWENFTEVKHIEYVPIQPGMNNVLLLLKINPTGRSQQLQAFENIIGPVYEKSELPRRGYNTPEKVKELFVELTKSWPEVQYLKQRLAQLSLKDHKIQ